MADLRWGQAQQQVLLNRVEIEEMLLQNTSIARIYEKLVAEKKYAGGRRTFGRHVATLRSKLDNKTDNSKSLPEATLSQPEAPLIESVPSDVKSGLGATFEHDAIPKKNYWGEE